MRTSFHHQPEAQHPKSPAIYTPAGRLPHLWSKSDQILRRSEMMRCANRDHRTAVNGILTEPPRRRALVGGFLVTQTKSAQVL